MVVIDDEALQAEALAMLLRAYGIRASYESKPEVALDRVLSKRPDALVLDAKMPGLSGQDLLATVREHHPKLPAVIVTGYEDHDPRVHPMLEMDLVRYVPKPVAMPQLFATLQTLLARRRA